MRFEFYIVEAGPQAAIQLRHLQNADLETQIGMPLADTRALAERRFAELVGSNPRIGQIIVVSSTIGELPGTVVAVEVVFTSGARIAATHRRLTWATEEGIPI